MLYPAGDTAPSAVPGWLCLELHAPSVASLSCNDTASLLQVTSQKGTSPTARRGMQDATTSAGEIWEPPASSPKALFKTVLGKGDREG